MKCRGYCDAETREQLCSVCLDRLAKMLRELPGLVDELEVTANRQSRGGSLTRGGRGERPLPFATSKALDRARRDLEIVVEWAAHVVAARTAPNLSSSGLRVRVEWAAAILLRELGWFRIDEQAGSAANAVRIVVERLERAVDRAPDRIHAGPCGALVEVEELVEDPAPGLTRVVPMVAQVPCEAPLVGEPGDQILTCRKCGAEHTAADRKAFQRAALAAAVLPLAEILPALPRLFGVEVQPGTVRVWKHRRKLIPADVTPAGVDLYRGEDVIAVAIMSRYRGSATGHAP